MGGAPEAWRVVGRNCSAAAGVPFRCAAAHIEAAGPRSSLVPGGAPLGVGVVGRMVYAWCMARTNIDIDEKACAAVMRRYRLKTKREAINFALRALAAEPLSADSARKLRGTGWTGDLDAMRTDRAS